eukprot:m.90376 g.90376  ORF g.90376 m.90376 type:complete len:59 (-) comp9857_c0_seq1:2103-2279(-)
MHCNGYASVGTVLVTAALQRLCIRRYSLGNARTATAMHQSVPYRSQPLVLMIACHCAA